MRLEDSDISYKNKGAATPDASVKDGDELFYVVRITCLPFLFLLAITWRVYVKEERFFASVPIADILAIIPDFTLTIVYIL